MRVAKDHHVRFFNLRKLFVYGNKCLNQFYFLFLKNQFYFLFLKIPVVDKN